MSAVERPTYFERQILSAADLDAQVGYARNALARHERHQHIWGVVHGLALSKIPTGLEIAPGLLVDGTGRQIVVAEARRVEHREFDLAGVFAAGDTDKTWFPVFIVGIDTVQPPLPFKREQCGSEGATRVDETFVVEFGRPGSEQSEPPTPDVDSTPGGAPGTAITERWRVLVGYVQWNKSTSEIQDARSDPEPGKSPRYAGVFADSVAARGGSLTIRTREDVRAGKPALKLQEPGPQVESLLEVGTLNANGSVKALLKLNEQGDLEVTGKVKGTLAAGALVVESGVVSDGMTIALPSGVTQEQVDAGEAQVHVLVSPVIDASAAPDTTQAWIATSLDCFVDATRLVHSRLRWMALNFSATPPVPRILDRPASCSYIIVASIKQK